MGLCVLLVGGVGNVGWDLVWWGDCGLMSSGEACSGGPSVSPLMISLVVMMVSKGYVCGSIAWVSHGGHNTSEKGL